MKATTKKAFFETIGPLDVIVFAQWKGKDCTTTFKLRNRVLIGVIEYSGPYPGKTTYKLV